jgi:hypothetical protein
MSKLNFHKDRTVEDRGAVTVMLLLVVAVVAIDH